MVVYEGEFPELPLWWSSHRDKRSYPWPKTIPSLFGSPMLCKLYGCESHDSSNRRLATALMAPMHWSAWEPISILSESVQCFRWPCGVLHRMTSLKLFPLALFAPYFFSSAETFVHLSLHFMLYFEGGIFELSRNRIL